MNGTHPRFPPHSVGVANLATRWHEVPLAPSLRELLSEREAEGVHPVGCYKSMDSPTGCVPITECLLKSNVAGG